MSSSSRMLPHRSGFSEYQKWYNCSMAQANHYSKLLLSFKVLDFVDFFSIFPLLKFVLLFDLLLEKLNFRF